MIDRPMVASHARLFQVSLQGRERGIYRSDREIQGVLIYAVEIKTSRLFFRYDRIVAFEMCVVINNGVWPTLSRPTCLKPICRL